MWLHFAMCCSIAFALIMLARIQRNLAALELFALVLWVGSLFFIGIVLLPQLVAMNAGDVDAQWRMSSALMHRFQGVELIFAAVVLASNFVKVAVFGRLVTLQRYALLAATLLAIFTATATFGLRPAIRDKRAQIEAAGTGIIPRDHEMFHTMNRQAHMLGLVNLALGLFLVYSWRHFEERKTAAISRLLQGRNQAS